MGELAAFIVGIVNIVGNILSGAAVARGWASYLQVFCLGIGAPLPDALVFFEVGNFSVSPAALFLIILLWAVNCVGLQATAKFNGIVTAASVVMLVI